MRYRTLTAVLLLMLAFISDSYSQINILRYNDYFSCLRSDSVQRTGLNKIRHMPVANGAYISFGGDLREQLQYYKNINFGDAKTAHPATVQLWQRLMLHSNLELGRRVRVFAQLNSTYRFFNTDPLTPEIDENKLSLHQAFVDYNVDKRWLLRMGRQEIAYGNNRILTFREGPNTRQTFDAAIVKYHTETRRVDLFAMSPIISQPGVFDDKRSAEVIVGLYSTVTPRKSRPGLDCYALNYSGNRRMYNFAHGNEVRQTYGLRIFSRNDRFNYEFEGTYQSGKFNNLHIKAYSVSADMNYAVIAKKVTIGIAGSYASGDKNKGDKELNTYNFLFSKPQYGLTAPIGATNMVNVNPYVSIIPFKAGRIDAGAYFMWRQSTQDGTYSPLAKEVRPAPAILFGSTGKRIGTLLTLESSAAINENLSLGADVGYFVAGNYTKETGKGKDISYLSFKASVKF